MRLHFLNVKNGDCSILEHKSGKKTIIDISNGNCQLSVESQGNFRQKENPTQPIDYLKQLNISSIHRFILTHPDMDHLDGLKNLFQKFNIANFWDTKHNKTMQQNESFFNMDDWKFYTSVRTRPKDPTILHYYSGHQIEEDGLYVLSPTLEIIKEANKKEKYNELSYVILWKLGKFKILFSGDSEDLAWNHILKTHSSLVSNIDILLAPHHGRHSDRDFSFLSVLKPRYSLLGNAKSEHLAYNHYKKHGALLTNNQAGNIVVEYNDENNCLYMFVENYEYAIKNHHFDKLYKKQIGATDYYYLFKIK